MLRYKQFSGSGKELDAAINAWLTQFEPDVNHMTQSAGPDGSTIVSFLFDESFRGQERRLTAEQGLASQAEPALPPTPDWPIEPTQEPA